MSQYAFIQVSLQTSCQIFQEMVYRPVLTISHHYPHLTTGIVAGVPLPPNDITTARYGIPIHL